MQKIKYPSSRIPVIDGLRGISVLTVIVSHMLITKQFVLPIRNESIDQFIKLIFHGHLGVQFFFVLSGFIITHILLVEYARNQSISLPAFYVRRAFRLLPALYFLILVQYLFSKTLTTTPISMACLNHALTFTVGILGDCNWNFAHFWSLTVEEVFYLAWPLLILATTRGLSIWVPTLLFVVLSRAVHVASYLSQKYSLDLPLSYVGILGNMDFIALGALLGYFYTMRPSNTKRIFQMAPTTTRVFAILLIYIPHFLAFYGIGGLLTIPFGTFFEPLGMVILLGSLLTTPRGFLYRLVSSRSLVFTGLISYSIYLWQQIFSPASMLATSSLKVLTLFPLNLAAIFLMGIFSYQFIERPFRLRVKSFAPEKDPAYSNKAPLPLNLGPEL